MKSKGLNIKGYEKARARIVSKLVHFRKRAGLTQVELASRLNVEQSAISRIEAGTRRLDTIELDAYLEALGVTKEEFTEYLK